MTKTLMVEYDLNKAGQDYDKLIEALKDLAAISIGSACTPAVRA